VGQYEGLDVSTGFNSTIPTQIGQLTDLSYLLVEVDDVVQGLTGTIPTQILQLNKGKVVVFGGS